MQAPFQPLDFPLFRVLLCYISGIVLGITVIPLAWMNLLAVMLVILVLMLPVLLYMQSKAGVRVTLGYIPALIIYPLFILGGSWFTLQNDPRSKADYFRYHSFNQLLISAREPAYLHGKMLKLMAEVEGGYDSLHRYHSASGLLLVSLTDTGQHIPAGQRLLVKNKAGPIPGPFNPGGFDYRNFEGVHQVYEQCLLSPGDLHVLEVRTSLTGIAFHMQAWAAARLGYYLKDAGSAAFLSAMIAGLRSSLPAALYTSFSRTGTVHIISISGMHVHIVFALLNGLVFFLRDSKLYTLRILRKVFLISSIWMYALVSGFSPAVCRCALAVSLMICSEQLDRKISGPLALSLSALLLLLYQPWLLADMGFQLSYLAVAGLYLFQSPVSRLIWFRNPLLQMLWNLWATSIAAQLLTFPLCLYYFHQFPVYFLLANLLIIPLTGLILYLGIGLLVCSFIPPLAIQLSALYGLLYRLMSWLLDTLSNLPGSVITDLYPGLPALILLTACIFAFKNFLTTRTRAGLLVLTAFFIMLLTENMYSSLSRLQQLKLLFLTNTKRSGICLLKGDQAWLYEKELPDEKTWQQIYRPALASLGISQTSWIPVIPESMLRFGPAILQIAGSTAGGETGVRDKHIFHILFTESSYLPVGSGQRQDLVIAGYQLKFAALRNITRECQQRRLPVYSIREKGYLIISF